MPSTSRYTRRGALAACGTLLLAGCTSGSDADETATKNLLERGEVTEEEHATMLAIRRLNGVGPWVTDTREVTTESVDDGFRLVAAFDLDRREMGSAEQQAEDVADSFGRTAVPLCEEFAASSGFERLAELALAGYVQTSADVERTDDGHAVAAELTMSFETVRSIDWSDYDRTSLPEDADSYAVHESVFADA